MERWTHTLRSAVLLLALTWWASPVATFAQSDEFGLSETEVEVMTAFGELPEFIPQFELLETAVAVLQGDIGALTNLLDVELLADIAGYGLAVDALQAGMDAVGLDKDYLENTVFPEITGAINDVLGDLTGLEDTIGAVQSTLSSVDGLIDGLGPAIDAVESAVEAVQALVDATTGWMNDVLDGVGGYLNDAGEWVSGAADDVGDVVEDIGDSVGSCFGLCMTLANNGEPWAFEPMYVDPETVNPTAPNHLGPMNALEPAAGASNGNATLSPLTPAGTSGAQVPADADPALAMLDLAAYPSVASPTELAEVTILHPILHGDVQGVEAADLGLDAVENTADLAKPISSPLASSLDEKVEWTDVPVTPFAPCEVGEWAHDNTHLYMCSAPNTWTRTALSEW